MGQDPEVIRQEIEETRANLGETADALSYKADVKGRAKENVQGKIDAVGAKAQSVKERVVGGTSQLTDAVPSGSDLKDGASSAVGDGATAAKQNARRAASVAQENPLGLAIGAVAIGFLGGLLLPSTRIENEKIGRVADDLKEQVRDAGEEALERGKTVAKEAVHTAKDAAQAAGEAARETAREQAPAGAR